MRMRRFERLLETHGSVFARWPRAEMPAALRRLEASDAARTRLAEAHRLDAAISATAPAPADARALERMRRHVALCVATSPLPTPAPLLGRWLRPLGQFASGAVVALGLSLGAYLGWMVWPEPAGQLDLLAAPQIVVLAEVKF